MPVLFTVLLSPLCVARGPTSALLLWLLSQLVLKYFIPCSLQGCPGAESQREIALEVGPCFPRRVGAAVQI